MGTNKKPESLFSLDLEQKEEPIQTHTEMERFLPDREIKTMATVFDFQGGDKCTKSSLKIF